MNTFLEIALYVVSDLAIFPIILGMGLLMLHRKAEQQRENEEWKRLFDEGQRQLDAAIKLADRDRTDLILDRSGKLRPPTPRPAPPKPQPIIPQRAQEDNWFTRLPLALQAYLIVTWAATIAVTFMAMIGLL